MSKIFDVQLLTYLLPPALLFILQDQRKQQIIEFVDHNIIPWLLDQKVVFNVRKWADYLVCTCIRMMFGTSQILFNITLVMISWGSREGIIGIFGVSWINLLCNQGQWKLLKNGWANQKYIFVSNFANSCLNSKNSFFPIMVVESPCSIALKQHCPAA